MTAAPINPSDLMFVRGMYGIKKELPVVPGLEGSGTVVAGGGGLAATALVGRRVACAAPNKGDGTWAEYMVTRASSCFPLLKHVSNEQGATLLVNPATAWALVETARREGHKAVVQTAAASALGRMVLALGNHFNLPVIHVVRREEQVTLLRSEGASYVLNSSEPSFEKQLRQLCKELNATIGFDAVAGEMTGQLLHAMPNGGRVIVYGALSLAGCVVNPSDLIFQGKRVEGFWLADWFRTQTPLTSLRTALALQRLFGSTLKTSVRACFPLEETATALKLYARSMTEGKVLLMPGLQRGKL